MNVEAHIRARLSHPVELWKPEPGDVLVGMVVGRYTFSHDQYGDSPALKVLVEDREVRWHAMGTVASDEVTNADPQFGDWIGVKYLGQEKGYHDWRFVHVPAQFAVGGVSATEGSRSLPAETAAPVEVSKGTTPPPPAVSPLEDRGEPEFTKDDQTLDSRACRTCGGSLAGSKVVVLKGKKFHDSPECRPTNPQVDKAREAMK